MQLRVQSELHEHSIWLPDPRHGTVQSRLRRWRRDATGGTLWTRAGDGETSVEERQMPVRHKAGSKPYRDQLRADLSLLVPGVSG